MIGDQVVNSALFYQNLANEKLYRESSKISQSQLTTVLVIYAGGTIGMVYDTTNNCYDLEAGLLTGLLKRFPHFHDSGFPVEEYLPKDVGSEWLITPLSAFGKRIAYRVMEYIPLLDSSNMTMSDWIKIATDIEANYHQYDAFLVLHGTDTMAYTASALSFLLENLGKTIIITGSQIPLSELRNDANDNFFGALTLAGHFVIPEVGLFFNSKLFRGNRTQKLNALDFNAFDSPNMKPLAKMGINIEVDWKEIWKPTELVPFRAHKSMNPNVGTLRLFPGITEISVRSFLTAAPLEGVIIETYGAGNAPSNRADLLKAMKDAIERGVILVNCSQCLRATVTDIYATGKALSKIGVIPAIDMTTEAALTKLSYLLSKNLSRGQVVQMMQENLRGELTPPLLTRFSHSLGQFSKNQRPLLVTMFENIINGTRQEAKILEYHLRPLFLYNAIITRDLPSLTSLCAPVENINSLLPSIGLNLLHIAIINGNVEAVEWLIKEGALVRVHDAMDRTPIEIACEKYCKSITITKDHDENDKNIIQLLHKTGAILTGSKNESDLFVKLIKEDNVAGIETFINCGFPYQKQIDDKTKQNVLHVAYMYDSKKVIEFLQSSSNGFMEELALQKDKWGKVPTDWNNTDSV